MNRPAGECLEGQGCYEMLRRGRHERMNIKAEAGQFSHDQRSLISGNTSCNPKDDLFLA